MSKLPSNTLSGLLANWQAGDNEALRAVFPRVYDELRRLAHRYLRKERPDHTLQSAALVHEAYLRLAKQGTHQFENREHFLAICAQLMRQILIESARVKKAAKRDGGYRITFDEGLAGKSPERGSGRPRRRLEQTDQARSSTGPHRGTQILRRSFHRRNIARARTLAGDRKAALGYRPALAASPYEHRPGTMTPERWQQVRDVLERALELASAERPGFLDAACQSDPSLRQEVETLLASDPGIPADFLKSSALADGLAAGTAGLDSICTLQAGQVFAATFSTDSRAWRRRHGAGVAGGTDPTGAPAGGAEIDQGRDVRRSRRCSASSRSGNRSRSWIIRRSRRYLRRARRRRASRTS